jgi:hypothetical protein
MPEIERKDGYIIVVLAFSLVFLVGFAAMAVDSGILYSSQTAAQRAADAAALAGAYTFIANSSATQPATATDRATSTAVTNKIFQATVQSGEVSVNVDIPNRRVTVDITHVEPTYFSKVLGFRNVTIHVQAVAEASASATGSACIKPWFLPNTVGSTQPPCQACASNEVIIDSSGNLTAFGTSKLGQTFTIHPGNPANAVGPGDFLSIQLSNDPDQSGGDAYRNNIAQCTSGNQVFCGNSYNLKTGAMTGPTRDGVECLVTLCTDPNHSNTTGTVVADTWNSFVNGVAWFNKAGGSTLTDSSHQVVQVAIWDTCNATGALSCTPGPSYNKLKSGSSTVVTVIGFGLIFIDSWNSSGDVSGHFIGFSNCLGSPSGGQTGPGGYPLRLVRTS